MRFSDAQDFRSASPDAGASLFSNFHAEVILSVLVLVPLLPHVTVSSAA